MSDLPEENIYGDLPWWLDKDQLDSLRLELQSLPPDEFEKYKQIVIMEHQKILHKYGKYIRQAYSDEDVSQRFVVTDQEGHASLREEWLKNLQVSTDSYADSKKSAASIYPQILGHFVSTVDPWRACPENQRQALSANLGSEEEAKKAVNLYVSSIIASEELIHLYQFEGTPLWFKEAGAKYCAKDLTVFPLVDETMSTSARFYGELVDKYGEVVHQLHWNGIEGIEERLKDKILAEFTPEKQKEIFPNYISAK